MARKYQEMVGLGLDIAQMIALEGLSLTMASKELRIHSKDAKRYLLKAYSYYDFQSSRNSNNQLFHENLELCCNALKLIDKRNIKLNAYYGGS